MHAAAQEHRLPEDLLGLVQRVREIQIGNEVVGEETSGECATVPFDMDEWMAIVRCHSRHCANECRCRCTESCNMLFSCICAFVCLFGSNAPPARTTATSIRTTSFPAIRLPKKRNAARPTRMTGRGRRRRRRRVEWCEGAQTAHS